MADYGAAVAQEGYDVKTCADRFLIYSSAFQSLKIYNRYSVSGTVAGANITISHNIGYYCPFIVIYNGNGDDLACFMCDSDGWTMHGDVNNTTATLTIATPSGFDNLADTTTVYYTVYLFLEDFSTISENNINTETSSGASSTDYGMKISKEGYDVKTCTDDQLILSSSFLTNIVHKKGNKDSTSVVDPLSVSHNLGYIPSALVYCKKTGESKIRMCEGMPYYLNILSGGRSGFFYKLTSSELLMGENYLNGVESDWRTGNTFYYIIFKEKKMT